MVAPSALVGQSLRFYGQRCRGKNTGAARNQQLAGVRR
jgi:hypothetical protein